MLTVEITCMSSCKMGIPAHFCCDPGNFDYFDLGTLNNPQKLNPEGKKQQKDP